MATTLTLEDIQQFQKHWKTKKKDELVKQMTEFLLVIVDQEKEIEGLKEQQSRRNTDYLSRCRSVGGVTLPPGV